MRIGYRIKTEELERMRIDYEDMNGELKSYKSQNEMLKDKIALLRSEFFKSEAKSKEDNSDLRAKVVFLEIYLGCSGGALEELSEYRR